MQILITNLKNNKPLSIKGTKHDTWLSKELNDLNFKVNTLNFKLDFTKKGDFIEVDGLMDGDFTLSCVRCLESIAYLIDEDFKLFLYKEDQKVETEHEIALNTKDLDFVYLDTNEIYPARLIREQLILSLPDYPVCNENNAKCHCNCKKDSHIENANLN